MSRWLKAQLSSLNSRKAKRTSLQGPRTESSEHARCCHGKRTLSRDHCVIGAETGRCREIEVSQWGSDAKSGEVGDGWSERQSHSMLFRRLAAAGTSTDLPQRQRKTPQSSHSVVQTFLRKLQYLNIYSLCPKTISLERSGSPCLGSGSQVSLLESPHLVS